MQINRRVRQYHIKKNTATYNNNNWVTSKPAHFTYPLNLLHCAVYETCLVPLLQALAAYAGRKNDLVGRETGKLKEATNVLNATLSSMNLPAALEDTSGMFLRVIFVCFRGSKAFLKYCTNVSSDLRSIH